MEEVPKTADRPSPTQDKDRPLQGITFSATILSLAFGVVSFIWVYVAGMVSHGSQVGESVPVIPAIGAALVLTLFAPMLRRVWSKLDLTQANVLLVYVFLCIAVTCTSVGVVRLLMPSLTAAQYFASPENNLSKIQDHIPDWLGPSEPEAVREMYEGADQGKIPWGPWIVPLVVWTVFLLATFVSMLGIMTLFRRRWAEKEHLTFPIVHLIQNVTDQSDAHYVTAFFRNPVMWAGFLLAAVYNLMNILNGFNPAVPALGRSYDLGGLFTERPWSALRPIGIAWRPENFGLGYLVSTEITLSVWVFYLLLRFSNVTAVAAGYDIGGFPFDRQQSAGAYLALGVFLVWVAREELGTIFRKAFGTAPGVDDSNEPMSYRWAVLSFIVGTAVMVFIAWKAGMLLWTALVYFGLILLFALVYARARAEAGAAMVWLFPFYQHKRMMFWALGSQPFAVRGNFQNMTIFSVFMFLSRGYFQSMMAYQIESSKIATEVRIRQRSMAKWLIVALIIGTAGAFFVHLKAYYTHGANIIDGGTTQGGYRVRLARDEYLEVSGYMDSHASPDYSRTGAVVAGAMITGILILLRSLFLRFPLHPLGFAMVTSYGPPLWGPFFLVWGIKTVVLRVGGMRLYRQLIPFFIGVVLGHFFTAGLVWGWLSLYNEMYRRYSVHFG